jgi:hypothetical protein
MLAMAMVLPVLLEKEKSPVGTWITVAIPLAILSGTVLFVVRGFEVADEAVVVRRSLWRNRIPLTGLESIVADPSACKGAWKICGNDGLFAMHGWFWSRRLGRFRAFVTDPENSVVLRFAGRTVVVSPENPRDFVSEVNRRLRRREDRR